MRLNPVIR